MKDYVIRKDKRLWYYHTSNHRAHQMTVRWKTKYAYIDLYPGNTGHHLSRNALWVIKGMCCQNLDKFQPHRSVCIESGTVYLSIREEAAEEFANALFEVWLDDIELAYGTLDEGEIDTLVKKETTERHRTGTLRPGGGGCSATLAVMRRFICPGKIPFP